MLAILTSLRAILTSIVFVTKEDVDILFLSAYFFASHI